MRRLFLKLALAGAAFSLCAPAMAAHRAQLRHSAVFVGAQELYTEDILTDSDISVEGRVHGDCTSLGGSVSVSGSVEGDLTSLGGPVNVSGSVNGDILAVGQQVLITGTVRGDVSAIGANVVLRDSAAVLGNISTIGGHVERGGNVVLKGAVDSTDLKMLGRMMPRLIKTGFSGSSDGFKAMLLGGALGLAGMSIAASVVLSSLLLFLIPPIFFPKNVENAALCMTQSPLRCAGVGLLVSLLVIPALLALAVSLVGLPLVPLAILLLIISQLLGFSAFASVLAERFYKGIKKPVPSSLLVRVGAGYLLLMGVLVIGRLLPLVGGLLVLLACVAGACGILLAFGSVYHTRMGSRHPRPPHAGRNPGASAPQETHTA